MLLYFFPGEMSDHMRAAHEAAQFLTDPSTTRPAPDTEAPTEVTPTATLDD